MESHPKAPHTFYKRLLPILVLVCATILSYLALIREQVRLPLLRMDFIFDPYQIFEARVAGADAPPPGAQRDDRHHDDAPFEHGTPPPLVIYAVLAVVSLGCALLVGYEMGASEARSWLHVIGYAVVVAFILYVIVDFEYPRLGLIRIEAFDRYLVDVRNAMK